QDQVKEKPTLVRSFMGPSAILEGVDECLLGPDIDAAVGRPCFPRVEQLSGFGPGQLLALDGVVEPVGECVLLVEVVVTGFADFRRNAETVFLPGQASLDDPSQDAGPLLFELFG